MKFCFLSSGCESRPESLSFFPLASLEAKALRYQGLPILSTDRLDIQAEN
jgi:hypothetical protein